MENPSSMVPIDLKESKDMTDMSQSDIFSQ